MYPLLLFKQQSVSSASVFFLIWIFSFLWLGFLFLMITNWLMWCYQIWNIHNLITGSSLSSFQVVLNRKYGASLSTCKEMIDRVVLFDWEQTGCLFAAAGDGCAYAWDMVSLWWFVSILLCNCFDLGSMISDSLMCWTNWGPKSYILYINSLRASVWHDNSAF